MNFQQILAIPFYFNIINTVFTESQLSRYGTEERAEILHISKIITREIQGVKNFYLAQPNGKTFIKIEEDIDKSCNSKYGSYQLKILLQTSLLFEVSGRNPLGIYSTYKLSSPSGKEDIFTHAGVDREFYNTLCIMNMSSQ